VINKLLRSTGDSTRRQLTSSVRPLKETPWRIAAMISAVWQTVIPERLNPERLKKRFPSAKATLPLPMA
jgi:hypothetical protein